MRIGRHDRKRFGQIHGEDQPFPPGRGFLIPGGHSQKVRRVHGLGADLHDARFDPGMIQEVLDQESHSLQ